MMIKAIVLDTETTGLCLPQVVELAYMSIDDDMLIKEDDVVCERFQPRKLMEAGASAVNGIFDMDLIGKPKTENLLQVMPVVGEVQYIVGHNVEFDANAINLSINRTYDFKQICTKRLAMSAYPNEKSYKLTRLIDSIAKQEAQDYIEDAHSAAADVMMCAILLKHITQTLNERDNKSYTLKELYEMSAGIGHTPYSQKIA